MTRLRPWSLAGLYLGAALVVGVTLFPLYYMAVSSVREPRALFARPSLLPLPFTTVQYTQLFSLTDFPVYFKNSLLVGVATALVTVVVGCPMAYAVVRYRVWGARLVIRLMLVAYMVPALLLAIPLYTLLVRAGLDDTLTGLVLAHLTLTLPLAVWLMSGFFRTLPPAVEEAALVEGASRVRAFWDVVVPMALPGVLTTAIFAFILSWTDYVYALVLTSSDSKNGLAGPGGHVRGLRPPVGRVDGGLGHHLDSHAHPFRGGHPALRPRPDHGGRPGLTGAASGGRPGGRSGSTPDSRPGAASGSSGSGASRRGRAAGGAQRQGTRKAPGAGRAPHGGRVGHRARQRAPVRPLCARSRHGTALIPAPAGPTAGATIPRWSEAPARRDGGARGRGLAWGGPGSAQLPAGGDQALRKGFKVTPVLKSTTTASGMVVEYPRAGAEVVAVIGELEPGGRTSRHQHPVPVSCTCWRASSPCRPTAGRRASTSRARRSWRTSTTGTRPSTRPAPR